MLVGALFKHWSLRLFAPDRMLRQTYETFKMLLRHDIRSHELMAEFAELYHEGGQEDLARTRARYRQLAEAVVGMVIALEQMLPRQAGPLHDYFNKYDFYIRLLLAPPEQFFIPPFVVAHDTLVDVTLVGQKSAHLLQLRNGTKVRVPPGFTVTTTTFALLVEHNRLRPAIDLLLASIDPESSSSLEETSQALMTLVRRMDIPDHVSLAIAAEYDRLASPYPDALPRVAVRSSAMHEDGKHSFAGQYHSVLCVARDELMAAYLEVVASKYTPQALLYRIYTGLGDEEAAMAVLVVAMVDAVASGVVYTRDPSTAGGEVPLLLQSIHGLGLPLVGGETIPDVYCFPPQSSTPSQVVAGCQLHRLMVYQGRLSEEPLAESDRETMSLSREQAMRLAATARELETFFGEPQDIEWALDRNHELYILQTRPLHIEATPPSPAPPTAALAGRPLVTGAKRAAGGIACGIVHHLDPMDTLPIPHGTVLVTRHIPPSLVRFIGRLEAVICEQGAVTGHFATVCREFGVVLLVGADGAATLLSAGAEVTVDGYTGAVYAGKVASLIAHKSKVDIAAQSDFSRKLRAVLEYITPLHLVDPSAASFRAHSTRSLHDIIRYAHETAVQTMFGLSDIASGTSSQCRKLETDLPLDIYLLDVGGAFVGDEKDGETIALTHLTSAPFVAIWQGLSHPDIDWLTHPHFDWQGFSDMALSGGIASGGSKDFASYAVVSRDYLNLNMRFGFHFTLVDCLCGEEARANYCQVRFAGGGGEYQGRSMRVLLISRILRNLGFEVNVRGDLLDARLNGYPASELCARLSEVGRLLGMTKLLDMVLQEQDIDWYAEQFLSGAGRFTRCSDPLVHSAG